MGLIYLSFKNMVEDDAYNEGYDAGQKYERQLQKETNFEN